MFVNGRDREQPPRFAQMGSFEFEFGQKWKKLYQMQKEQEEMLKRNFEEEVAKLEMDQETAQLEQHAIMLRQGITFLTFRLFVLFVCRGSTFHVFDFVMYARSL